MKNEINQKKFNEYPIFKGLELDEIQQFTHKIEVNKYSEDEIIIKEGDDGNSILFLLNGEINISQAITLPTNKYKELDKPVKPPPTTQISTSMLSSNVWLPVNGLTVLL